MHFQPNYVGIIKKEFCYNHQTATRIHDTQKTKNKTQKIKIQSKQKTKIKELQMKNKKQSKQKIQNKTTTKSKGSYSSNKKQNNKIKNEMNSNNLFYFIHQYLVALDIFVVILFSSCLISLFCTSILRQTFQFFLFYLHFMI